LIADSFGSVRIRFIFSSSPFFFMTTNHTYFSVLNIAEYL